MGRKRTQSILRVILLGSLITTPAVAQQPTPERMTPMLLEVQEAPVAFRGSDGRTHLVYEVWLSNFSSADAVVEQVEVLGSGGEALVTLDADAIGARLQAAGQRSSNATMASGAQSLLFVHVVVPPDRPAPRRLSHRVKARFAAAPPGHEQISATGGEIAVDERKVVLIGPPLRGERYVAADSCCDSSRHTRAALPVNGRVRLAQRFAVDWEQLDGASRIYDGAQAELKSYTIYGKPVIAVADARVANVVDGLPEQTPGKFPEALAIEQADGNSVVLDLGGGAFALYAHMQPGSIRVRPGQRVRRGDVIGLVGNTGNSVAPHLHFHVMDSPSPLSSNGLPYAIDSFTITGATAGTAAFDEAEEKGTPLAITPVEPPLRVKDSLPLDQRIVTF